MFCFCSAYCRKPHPLGLSSQAEHGIPYQSITASAETSSSASSARLRNSRSWCGAKSKPNQWISVDLGQLASISGVASQGSRRWKVTEYKIRYSYDGRIWYGYPSNTRLQVRNRTSFHFPFFFFVQISYENPA
jgi:hypothetical protein